MTQTETRALRFHETGKAADVLRLETVPITRPAAAEVTVRLLASVIHPSDFGIIGGTYGRLRELPAVAGREGIGEVVALGDGVTDIAEGDRVAMPGEGAWVEQVNAPAATLRHVPPGLPVLQAAMAFINPPTALRLLRDFVTLEPGSWVIQNAANSAVGFCVVRLATRFGLNTLNVVRNPDKWREPLTASGATAVVADGDDFYKQVAEITGGPKPKLAVNSVGGDSAIKLVRCLADGGTMVTIGGMVGDKVRFPTRNLIFNDVTLRGFWMDRWNRTADRASREAMEAEIFGLIKDGTIEIPIAATFPFEKGLEAVAAAAEGGRDGKTLIVTDAAGV